jgi:Fe-S-cluster containining protein
LKIYQISLSILWMIACLSIGEHTNRNDIDLDDICIECGGYCCRLGGVVATKNEVDAIIQRGYPNHFIQLSSDVYGTEWGDDGTCVYLENGRCTIYAVRPLGCRMFPVVQTRSGDVILIECPLAAQLSEELAKRKKVLKQRPNYIIKESACLREEYIKDLQIRATRYHHQKL